MKKLEILRLKLIRHLLMVNDPIKINKVLNHKELRGYSLEKIIFDLSDDKKIMIPELLTELRLCEYIDYENISFNGVDLLSIKDFRNFKNLKINPQRVYDKCLSDCIFDNVTFIGGDNKFDMVIMSGKTEVNGKRISLINKRN